MPLNDLLLQTFFDAGVFSRSENKPKLRSGQMVLGEQLKPCPHCGSDMLDFGHPVRSAPEVAVECLGCGDFGPLAETEQEAAAAYNRRAPEIAA